LSGKLSCNDFLENSVESRTLTRHGKNSFLHSNCQVNSLSMTFWRILFDHVLLKGIFHYPREDSISRFLNFYGSSLSEVEGECKNGG
jgi:hypothetical protein